MNWKTQIKLLLVFALVPANAALAAIAGPYDYITTDAQVVENEAIKDKTVSRDRANYLNLDGGQVLLSAPQKIKISKFSQQEVKKAQIKLNEAGFYKGVTDGLMGPQTRQALKAFQKANDLEVTGQLSAMTLKAMQVSHQELYLE